MKELIFIQKELKAPKGQYNAFGKYRYRSCEDILEAVKPLAASQGCTLVISDELVLMGDRYYIKATARLTNEKGQAAEAAAFAREAERKSGMDESQITGSASSYARKYALNGLFAIDDTKDADATNTHGKTDGKTDARQAKPADAKGKANEPRAQEEEQAQELGAEEAMAAIAQCGTQKDLLALFNAQPRLHSDKAFMTALTQRKNELRKTD